MQTDATTSKKFDLFQNFAQELVPITRTNVQQSVQTDETCNIPVADPDRQMGRGGGGGYPNNFFRPPFGLKSLKITGPPGSSPGSATTSNNVASACTGLYGLSSGH